MNTAVNYIDSFVKKFPSGKIGVLNLISLQRNAFVFVFHRELSTLAFMDNSKRSVSLLPFYDVY